MMDENNKPFYLKYLTLQGFKSIDSQGQRIDFSKDVTILIGANGAGKSNLISFFKMLNYMMTGGLRQFVAEQGYANSILYYGPEVTHQLKAELCFAGTRGDNVYRFNLTYAAGDMLIFTKEETEYRSTSQSKPRLLEVGHKEAFLPEASTEGNQTAKIIKSTLDRCRVYQFHNTSSTAKIRNYSYINDNRYLRDDAGNLAAFLYALKENKDTRKYYQRIVRYIRQIIPQFGDFILAPSPRNDNYITLTWREEGRDYLFGPHQLSDGSLRFMALVTLFLQPPETLPNTIIVDEPELGLHPAAMSIFHSLMQIAGRYSQVILATQSPRLVDEFEARHIVVVERDDQNLGSIFKRLDQAALADWLSRYTLSELWEKNVLRGLP